MSTNKHTPGPWRYVGHFGTHCLDSKGRCIADAPQPNGMSEEEGFANARLISAAPEMLAALEAVAASFDSKEKIHPKSRHTVSMAAQQLTKEAIAKAKGL